jgi:hypothetical protein
VRDLGLAVTHFDQNLDIPLHAPAFDPVGNAFGFHVENGRDCAQTMPDCRLFLLRLGTLGTTNSQENSMRTIMLLQELTLFLHGSAPFFLLRTHFNVNTPNIFYQVKSGGTLHRFCSYYKYFPV